MNHSTKTEDLLDILAGRKTEAEVAQLHGVTEAVVREWRSNLADGLSSRARVARRAAAISREVDELRANTPLAGTPAEIVDRLGPFAQAGVQRVYLQLLDQSDLDHLEVFAAEVVPQL